MKQACFKESFENLKTLNQGGIPNANKPENIASFPETRFEMPETSFEVKSRKKRKIECKHCLGIINKQLIKVA